MNKYTRAEEHRVTEYTHAACFRRLIRAGPSTRSDAATASAARPPAESETPQITFAQQCHEVTEKASTICFSKPTPSERGGSCKRSPVGGRGPRHNKGGPLLID